MEINLGYSKPELIFLKKAIKNYDIKKEEISDVRVPTGVYFTLLKGPKNISVFYGDKDTYNEQSLFNVTTTALESRVDFESTFKKELISVEKTFHINVNKGMGRDGLIGKGERKILAEFFSKLIGIYSFIDGDVQDSLEPIVINPTKTTSKVQDKFKKDSKETIEDAELVQPEYDYKNLVSLGAELGSEAIEEALTVAGFEKRDQVHKNADPTKLKALFEYLLVLKSKK